MKITVLAENTACRSEIGCEHGLSLFIETDGVSINSVSGDVSLSSLPKDGAEITFKKVSGDLLTQKAFEKDGSTYVFGGGGTRIDVKTVSGDLRVG